MKHKPSGQRSVSSSANVVPRKSRYSIGTTQLLLVPRWYHGVRERSHASTWKVASHVASVDIHRILKLSIVISSRGTLASKMRRYLLMSDQYEFLKYYTIHSQSVARLKLGVYQNFNLVCHFCSCSVWTLKSSDDEKMHNITRHHLLEGSGT